MDFVILQQALLSFKSAQFLRKLPFSHVPQKPLDIRLASSGGLPIVVQELDLRHKEVNCNPWLRQREKSWFTSSSNSLHRYNTRPGC